MWNAIDLVPWAWGVLSSRSCKSLEWVGLLFHRMLKKQCYDRQKEPLDVCRCKSYAPGTCTSLGNIECYLKRTRTFKAEKGYKLLGHLHSCISSRFNVADLALDPLSFLQVLQIASYVSRPPAESPRPRLFPYPMQEEISWQSGRPQQADGEHIASSRRVLCCNCYKLPGRLYRAINYQQLPHATCAWHRL